MKNKIPLLLSLFWLSGCEMLSQALQNIKVSPNATNPTSSAGQCADKPTGVLKKTKPVTLSSQSVSESDQVSETKAVGFLFDGKAGETLSYSTKDDICLWVIQPNNLPLSGTKLPENGKYTVQVVSKQGSKTFTLEMSLGTLQTSLPQSPPPSPAVYSLGTSPPSPPPNSLTQEEAYNLVANWYKAKPRMFGPSYDENLVSQYTTGTMYYDNLRKGDGGSLGWLKNNGCYYTYDYSNIRSVQSFNPSSTQPSLTVRVSERLQLHGPASAGCDNRPKTYTKTITYWFAKDNGIWKLERTNAI